MNNIEIGRRIRKLRKDLDMTQTQLAKELNYKSNSVISKLETGDSELTATQIRKFTKYFNVSTDYLLKGISNNSNEDNGNYTKQIKVKKKLNFFRKEDYILIGSLFVLMLLTSIFEDQIRSNMILTLFILSILLLFYFVIVKIIRHREISEILNIPKDKNVKYYCKLNNKVIKKYRRNSIMSGILVILTNIMFYGILITILSEDTPISPTPIVGLLAFLIIFKSTVFVISKKLVERDVTFILILIFMIELIVSSIYLYYIHDYSSLTTQIALLTVFNMFVYFIVILTTDLYLSKFYYKVE